MKRFFLILLIVSVCGFVEAQSQKISVQKTIFVPTATGVFEVSQVSATNTKTGNTIVVWEKSASSNTDHSIVARLLNSAGKPISPPYTLVNGPRAAHPSVTYNPIRNEFVLVYDDNPLLSLVHCDVYVQRLTPGGKLLGLPVKATTDTTSAIMANLQGRVVFNPVTSGYTLLWLREAINSAQVTAAKNGLVGVSLTNTGTVVGDVTILQKTISEGNNLWDPVLVDFQVQPSSGNLMVAFSQVQSGTSGGQSNYYLGRIDPLFRNVADSTFVKINTKPVFITPGFPWSARFGFQSTGAGYVIFVDAPNLKRRRLNADGSFATTPQLALRPPKNSTQLFFPALAVANGPSGSRGLMIAVENAFSASGNANVWAQELDQNGTGIGAPIRIDATSSTSTALRLVLFTLPPSTTIKDPYRYSGFYSVAAFQAPGQTFISSGLIQLNLTLHPTTTARKTAP